MEAVPARRYRVVQWATGNIGAHALRCVVEHPALELAGVYVHTPEKAGRDAGELCGKDATGVIATNSVDEIVALAPDCVLYMPLVCDMDEVCRLLASGANIVTTCGEFHHPAGMAPDVRSRVESACAEGVTSIHSTGSSPGFITEALPLALLSVQRELRNLTIDEYADLSRRDSPAILFDIMGFGGAPKPFDEYRLAHTRNSYGPSLHLLADALGLPLDSVEASGEFAVTRKEVRIAAGTLPAGTVGAQRITAAGMRGGKPLLRFRATWYCTADLDTDWPLQDNGWHVSVDGDAPLDIDIRFPIPVDRIPAVLPGYTAHRAVNAIAHICAATPGIRTTTDLPNIVATLG